MAVYRLAEKYGQSPAGVMEWPASVFDEAWDLLVAENTEKWPVEKGETYEEHPRPQAQTLLDRERHYWQAFIVDGALDEARLAAENYSPVQIPWLRSQMIELGWLEEQHG